VRRESTRSWDHKLDKQAGVDLDSPFVQLQRSGREELRRLLNLAAQLPRSRIGVFYLRGCIAPGSHQRRPERYEQVEFLPGAFVGVWQAGK
jgi:hypothetical protein